MGGASKTIAVVGSQGRLAQVLTERLLADRHRVRPMFRSPRSAAQWASQGADPFIGSTTSLPPLVQGLQGAEVVVVIPPRPLDPEDLLESAGRSVDTVVEAIAKTGPRELLLVSTIGAHLETTGRLSSVAHQFEARLRGLAPLRVLRPAILFESLRPVLRAAMHTGRFQSVLQPLHQPVPLVAAADVAAVVAAWAAGAPSASERLLELEGPRRWSPNAMAALLTEVTGTLIDAVEVPEAAWAEHFSRWGASDEAVSALRSQMAALNAGQVTFEGTPRKGPTPFEATLSSLLR